MPDLDSNEGVGVSQGDSGSAANLQDLMEQVVSENQQFAEQSDAKAGQAPQEDKNPLDTEVQTDESDATADQNTLEATDDTSEEVDEVDAILDESDKSEDTLVQRLRQTIKGLQKGQKEYEAKLAEVQTTQESEQGLNAESLVNALKSFDVEAGKPTARPFVEQLYQADSQLAAQVFEDLAQLKDEKGWTLGHYFLEQQGLDPTRLEEVRDFLKGDQEEVVKVSEIVPEEYQEAYQSLSKAIRDDVLYDLESSDPQERSTALEILRDRQFRLEQTQQQEKLAREQAQKEQAEIVQKVQDIASETYHTMFEAIEKGETFTKTAITGNQLVDDALKHTFVTQLNALGNPNTMLAERAASFMERAGVKIDYNEVQNLINTMHDAFQVKVVAEQKGYTAHANQAANDIKKAAGRLTALGNKYFVSWAKAQLEASRQQSEKRAQSIESNAGVPTLDGQPAGQTSNEESKPPELLLKELAERAAQANRQLAS